MTPLSASGGTLAASTKTMKTFSRSILVFFLIISCNKKQEDKTFFNSGNLKELKKYDSKGILKEEVYYYDIKDRKIYKSYFHKNTYDSLVYYYRNGKVFRNGKSDKKGNLFGKWNYYNIAGYLSDTREFFIINDDYKLNQLWYFNKKGDTIINANPKFNVYQQKEFASSKVSESSIFLNFSYYPKSDTIKVNENLSIDVEDLYPFWATKNSEEFMVIAKQKNNFNSNFSNINQVKLDTVYNSFTLKSNWKYKKAIDLKHSMFLVAW